MSDDMAYDEAIGVLRKAAPGGFEAQGDKRLAGLSPMGFEMGALTREHSWFDAPGKELLKALEVVLNRSIRRGYRPVTVGWLEEIRHRLFDAREPVRPVPPTLHQGRVMFREIAELREQRSDIINAMSGVLSSVNEIMAVMADDADDRIKLTQSIEVQARYRIARDRLLSILDDITQTP